MYANKKHYIRGSLRKISFDGNNKRLCIMPETFIKLYQMKICNALMYLKI